MLRLAVLGSSLVLLSACSESSGRVLASSPVGEVTLVQTGPDVPLTPAPEPLEVHLVAPTQLLAAEPLPLPARHRLTLSARPAGARSLGQLEALDVEVAVEAGPRMLREVSVVFVSPLGLAWEHQTRVHDGVAGDATLRFSLPIATTLVEDQGLSGTWTITSHDSGRDVATASFEVLP
jgi:hypothetical protein